MIAEIFDNEIKGRLRSSQDKSGLSSDLSLNDLAPIFTKMRLPLPEDGVNISRTNEGGYNLMLNRYSAVLRIYPNSKDSDDEGKRLAHLYHPDVLPAIGLIQSEGFAMELIGGKPHSQDSEFKRLLVSKRIERDTGFWERPLVYNFADVEGKPKNLDVVGEHKIENYEKYGQRSLIQKMFGQKSLLDKLLDESKPYESLQQSFYEAWTDEISFDDFWKEMEAAKASGLLSDGWNDSPFSMSVPYKGDIIALADAYEVRLKVFHGEPVTGPQHINHM